MTRDRDTKRQVRARMRSTGERYTQARSALFGPSTPAAQPWPDAGGGAMDTRRLLETLDRDGYAVVRNVVAKPTIDELRDWVDGLVEKDMAWRMQEVARRREAGEADARPFPRGSEGRIKLRMHDDTRRRALVDAVADIAAVIGTPMHGDGGIAAVLPGWGGHDGLHQDLSGPAPDAGSWDGAVLTFPLTPWEGMRLVPGSHRRDPVFREGFASAVGPHPDEVFVEAGPGDVVVNSIHTWKSSTLNRLPDRRAEIWIGYLADESVSNRIRQYWANTPVFHAGVPADSGAAVKGHYEPTPDGSATGA